MSRLIRIPNEAYNNLIAKKIRMEEVAKRQLNFPINIPMTRIIQELSSRKLIITDDKLKNMCKKIRKT
jgi:hypothetical protein